MKHTSKPVFGGGMFAFALLALASPLLAETEIIDGYNATVFEFTSPDDLHLDPNTAVVAVSVFGDEDREVNGILFRSDRDGSGVAEEGGVTVTTTAANSIDGWAAAAPAFSGGQGNSAENLGLIMQDIRWEAAPAGLTVEVEGLDPGVLYEIQLLVNEGADRARHWDIGVGDLDAPDLVIDDFTSEGDSETGVWSGENSFAAKLEALAGADGKLNVVMQQHIGGQDQLGSDNNPILQAFILHRAAVPPPAFAGVWMFDGDARDGSGKGNDGELVDAQFSDDVPRNAGGKSLELTGGSHVLVEHAESLNITNAITIAAWVKPIGDVEWDGIIAKNPSTGSGPNHAGNYELRVENGGRFLHFLHQQGGADDTAFHQGQQSLVAADVWTHVAVTADTTSKNVNFYVNGELTETLEGIIAVDEFPTNENPLFIGSRADLFTAFDGLLDEVVLAGEVLDEDEIADLFANGPLIPFIEVAYKVQEGVIGNQEFGGALGLDFIVNQPIQVLELGAFDSGSDELALDITVELWSRNDGGTPDVPADDSGGGILASLEFSGAAGVLAGGSRFLPLAAPVTLLPGAYTIVGWGYGTDEPNYNLEGRDGEPEGLTTTDRDFLTFVGGSRFGDPGVNGTFPSSPDGGPANRYGAGTFKFTTSGDSDGDGMPDAWEDSFGLDKGDPADAALDPDGDTLTSRREFDLGTNPKADDSDVDGLKDNVETNTGTWISATDTGTHPARNDTDRDKLLDGVETNTGTFVSATNTGTNPHVSDTDGDGAGDGTEVTGGTNPLDPFSVPSPFIGNGDWEVTHIFTEGDPTLSDAFGVEEVIADPGAAEVIKVKSRSIHFHDNVVPPIFQQESRPYPLWDDENGGEGGFGDREDFLIEAKGNINVKASGLVTFVCNSDDGFQLFIDDELIGEAGNRGRSDTIMEVELTAGVHTLRFIHWERGGGAGVTLANYRGLGTAPGAPNSSDWELTRAFVDATDTDGDGITDLYEEANGLDKNANDAGLDKDGDGLTNKQEFDRGLRANLADTDGDGFGDGVETKTGIWVSATNTGTDPLKPDSDKDGLKDGVETNTGIFVSATDTGTDPNKKDTDGDAANDGIEVSFGSNPNDKNDGPVSAEGPNLLAWWDFDDASNEEEIADRVAGLPATINGPEYAPGKNGGGMLFTSGGGALEIEDAGFMNLAATVDKLSVVLWQKNDGTPDSSSFWFNSPSSNNGQRGAQAHIPWSDGNIYYDTAGCCDPSQRLAGNPTGTIGEFDWADEKWHHFVFWKDGESKRIYVDGELFLELDGAAPLPTDFTIGHIGGDSSGGANPSAAIDDFAVFAWPLTEEQIAELVGGATPGDLAGVGSGVPFQISSVVRTAAGVTLTWPSISGQQFSVEYSTTLSAGGWIELEDGLDAEGEETSFQDTDAGRLGLEDGYYRIRKN